MDIESKGLFHRVLWKSALRSNGSTQPLTWLQLVYSIPVVCSYVSSWKYLLWKINLVTVKASNCHDFWHLIYKEKGYFGVEIRSQLLESARLESEGPSTQSGNVQTNDDAKI